jgi:hypothetical protein
LKGIKFILFYFRTELAVKFKIVAANRNVAPSTCFEVEKPYPIVGVVKRMRCTGVIILLAPAINAEEFGSCELSTSYSGVFNEDQISKLKAERGKYKLIWRKRML